MSELIITDKRYTEYTLEYHINTIRNLSKSSNFKIGTDYLNNFVSKLLSDNDLSEVNKFKVSYRILFTIENIIRNQNITHPFGVNSKNSKPNSGEYGFDISKGVYHSHILKDEKSSQLIVLIWYILKEEQFIEDFTIKFRYMPHPSIPMYKSIIKDI